MIIKENNWKLFSCLNTKAKNLSTCKFSKENRRAGEKLLYVYAFNGTVIERVNLHSLKQELKWEVVKIKSMIPLNSQAASLQFDDNLILLFGGVNDQNSMT